jgi:hypothetical protein
MTEKELYRYRIDHLLCTYCGEPIEPKSGRMCPTCTKLKRAKDAIRRENLTDEDRQKRNEYYKAWREEHKGYKKMRYEMAKAQGLCTQCGKPNDNPKGVRCLECCKYQKKLRILTDEQRERKREYVKEYHRTHYRKKADKSVNMSVEDAIKVLKDARGDDFLPEVAEALDTAIETMKSVKALSAEINSIGRECMDEGVLIGFNMAVALFNKHLGG